MSHAAVQNDEQQRRSLRSVSGLLDQKGHSSLKDHSWVLKIKVWSFLLRFLFILISLAEVEMWLFK